MMRASSWERMEVGMYTRRFYRTWSSSGKLKRFRIIRYESDLEIAARSDLTIEALRALHEARGRIEEYGRSNPGFLDSLVPLKTRDDAPSIVGRMMEVSRRWSVGGIRCRAVRPHAVGARSRLPAVA